MKVAIVILNYKGLANTLECIDSVKRSVIKSSTQIIVVDNNSQDNSIKNLKKVKDINLIINNDNLGYSGGNNVGIKFALKSGADYICILNNDTIVDKSVQENLIKSTDLQTISSPKIYFQAGFEFHKNKYKEKELGKVIWYAGGQIDWNNIVGLHRGVDEVDRGQYDKTEQVEFATGACIFAPAAVFNKIGFFDEKYFLYLEDMDFCVRAKRQGFKIIYQPKAVIWHKNAASAGGSGSKLQDYYITRNRLLFAFRYAKVQTKIAVFKQILSQYRDTTKKNALLDFLMMRFGKCTREIK